MWPTTRSGSKRSDSAPGAVLEVSVAAFFNVVIAQAYGGVRSVLREPARIEEVTHDVVLELWTSRIVPTDGHGPTATTVTTLARRRAAERDRRDPSPPMSSGSYTGDVVDLGGDLDALPNEIRELIVLAQVPGLTQRELARVVDEPEGVVAERVRAGLAALGRSGLRPDQAPAVTPG